MAAFHPATVRLLRRDLDATIAQHERDQNKRVKFDVTSKSKMAIKLSERIGEAVCVMRDLQRLLTIVDGINLLHDEHERGTHPGGRPVPGCPDCIDSGAVVLDHGERAR